MTKSRTSWRIVATVTFGLAGALMIGGAAAAQAQTAPQDPRWRAWLGCWAPVGDLSRTQVCVVPASGISAVDIVTVVGGKTVSRERVQADGEHHASTKDECTGSEVARWSGIGKRVYLRAEYLCPGDLKRGASTLIAISATGEWLSVQDVSAGGNNAVRVTRYRPSTDTASVPLDMRGALGGRTLAANTARIAAGAPLTTTDIIEASGQLDVAVVEAWLSERGQNFGVDARQLVRLADAGVPDRITDLIVALSYPTVFAVNPESDQAQVRSSGGMEDRPGLRGVAGVACDPYSYYSPFSYSPYGWDYGCPSFGYGYYGSFYSPYYRYSPYGYGTGFGGWYNSGQPVVVFVNGPENAPQHGRVVNGHGYSQSGSGTTGTSGGSGSGGSTTGGSPASSGGASSSTPARTAVPKKP